MPAPPSFAETFLASTIGRGEKRGLSNMREVMAHLGDPHRAFPVVHVTGTNGKGSCVSFLASILDAAGMRVGLFTSPHLLHPRERICVGRAPLPARAFDRAARRVAAGVEACGVHPIYFEATAMVAMEAFRAAGVDLAIVEVGVGGRQDATNVVAPEVCVVTEIGFDHEKALGDTLEAIATEKLGIVKPGADFVTGCADPSLAAFLLTGAISRGAASATSVDALSPAVAPPPAARKGSGGERLRLDHPRFGRFDLTLRMTGAHQIRNALCALEAADRLAARGFPVTRDAALRGLARALWPARFERIATAPDLYVDGAHNESGADSLARAAARTLPGREITLVFGIFRDKRVAGVIDRLAPLSVRVVATAAPNDRAVPPEELAALFRGRGLPAESVADPVEAVRRALATTPQGGAVLVAGSIYLVGLIRARFSNRRFRPF